MSALLGGAQIAEAASFNSIKVTESARLTQVRPNWPVPAEPNQLFYIQRSTNSNTVVYTARLDASGVLDNNDPVEIYWRRYNTTGERKALKYVEAKFAYGVQTRRTNTPGTFIVTLKPLPEIAIQLRQASDGTLDVRTRIGGKWARPVYGYLSVEEGGLLPRVTGFSLHGIDLQTGRAISETFSVTGGEIAQ